jgi:hypothetical protein
VTVTPQEFFLLDKQKDTIMKPVREVYVTLNYKIASHNFQILVNNRKLTDSSYPVTRRQITSSSVSICRLHSS